MNEADKAEWIAEKAASIFYGHGGGNEGVYVIAEMKARRCWEETYGEEQKGLF